MKRSYNKKRTFIMIIVVMFSILLLGMVYKNDKNTKKNEIRGFLKEIDEACASVGNDIEGNREKYLELLKTEKDYLKRGMYNSALSYISTITSDYENILKYSVEAIENYEKVKYGEYLAAVESKYLSWSMMRVGKYSESFTYANKTLGFLEKNTENIFARRDIVESEVTIYSIFTIIYSEFGLKEGSSYYYNKLLELEAKEKIEAVTLEKMTYAKMCYGESIEDYEITKKEATAIYEVALENDKRANTNFAEASLLNIAMANVKLGNLEEGMEQLKRAEAFFNALNDEHSLAFCYVVYGDYYDQKNNYQLAKENYNKAIAIMEKLNDQHKTKIILNQLIELGEKYNDSLTNEYEKYYEICSLVDSESNVNKILEQSLLTSESINKNRIEIISREKNKSRNMNIILTTTLIILIILCILVFKLYKKKKISELKLEEMVNRDYLTGVRTRDYGFKTINKLIEDNVKFSIAIIDIDNFKNINDSYGHMLGDEVLKIVAEKIKKAIGEDNIVIRFGGEEFIIVFKNLSKEEGKLILEKVLEDLNELLIDDKIKVSFSGGIDNFIGENIKKTIDEVDKLLYKAKNNGKNQIMML